MQTEENRNSVVLDDTFLPLLRLKTISRMIFLKGMDADEGFDLSELRAEEVYSIGEMLLSNTEKVEDVIKRWSEREVLDYRAVKAQIKEKFGYELDGTQIYSPEEWEKIQADRHRSEFKQEDEARG